MAHCLGVDLSLSPPLTQATQQKTPSCLHRDGLISLDHNVDIVGVDVVIRSSHNKRGRSRADWCDADVAVYTVSVPSDAM